MAERRALDLTREDVLAASQGPSFPVLLFTQPVPPKARANRGAHLLFVKHAGAPSNRKRFTKDLVQSFCVKSEHAADEIKGELW